MKENIFDKVSFWIVCAVAFLAPIFFLPISFASIIGAKMSLIYIGAFSSLALFTIARLRQGTFSFKIRTEYLLMLALLFVYLLSSWKSVSPYASFVGSGSSVDTFFSVFVLFSFVVLIGSLAKSTKKATKIIFLLAVSIFVAQVYQIVRIFGGEMFTLGALLSPSTTVAGRWNDLVALSVIFLIGIVVVLENIRIKAWIKNALTLLIVMPLFFVALSSIVFDFHFFTVSISMFICIASLVLFAYIYSTRKVKGKDVDAVDTPKKKLALPIPSLAFLILSVVLVYFSSAIGEFLVNTTNVRYVEAPITWNASYEVGKQAFFRHPYLGSGPSTFAYDWNLYKPFSVNTTLFWNTNIDSAVGLIPTTLFTTGILGFLLWMAFYVFTTILAVRILFSKDSGLASPIKSIVSLSYIWTMFLMFFYTPGQVVVFVHFLLIGLLFALDEKKRKVVNVQFANSQWKHFASAFVSIVFVLILAFFGFRSVEKDLAYRYAYLSNQVGSANIDSALLYINKAISLDGNNPALYQIRAQIYLYKLSVLMQSGSSAKTADMQTLANAMVSDSNLAIAKDPSDWQNFVFQGKILEYLGSLGMPKAFEGSVLDYKQAILLSPANPLPYIYASDASLALKNLPDAKDYLSKAITLKSVWSDSPSIEQAITSMVTAINKGVSPATSATSTPSTKSESQTKSKSTK